MRPGPLGLLQGGAGLAHVGSLYLIEERLEDTTHAELEDGTAEDVLDVGEGVGDLDQIVGVNGVGQFAHLLLQQGDAKPAPVRGGQDGTGQDWALEEPVEGGHGRERVGIDKGGGGGSTHGAAVDAIKCIII